MTPTDPKGVELRRKIAIAECCRGILYGMNMLTEVENEKVFNRILKFQDNNDIEITDAQMFSVEIGYNDNVKDYDPD